MGITAFRKYLSSWMDMGTEESLSSRKRKGVGHSHRESMAVRNLRRSVKRYLNVATHIGANPLSASSGKPSRRNGAEFIGSHNVVPDLLAPEGRAAENNVVERIRETT
jgi:hypothetical protein